MDELYHYGVKGQIWGVRRFQNYDGTLTPAGRRRAVKTLNNYEQQKLRAQEYAGMYDKKSDKLIRDDGSIRNMRKYRKLVDTAEEYRRNADKFDRQGKEFLHKVMDSIKDTHHVETSSRKYDVSTEGFKRATTLLGFLFGVAGIPASIILGRVTGGMRETEGTGYKIKKNKAKVLTGY